MNIKSEKRTYSTPEIKSVMLDNNISLILESANSEPGDPGEPGLSNIPEYLNNNPFKTTFS